MKKSSSPAFFKVFIAGISDRNMKIPLAFTEGLEQTLPQKVYLKDRNNNVWAVKVGNLGNCWHFLDGWVKFSRDNFLCSGDILVFDYFCDSWFYVLVYGASATEKNIVPCMPMGTIEMQEAENGLKNGSTDETGGDEYEYEDDQEFALEEANTTVGADTSINSCQVSLKRDCYGMELFQTGVAQQPINPYFVTKVMQKRKADLFVPKDIMKDFNIEFTDEVMLVDPANRLFHGKCRKWNDGRVIISGGWRSLCRLNLVARDDKCICEFVQGAEGEPLVLNVSFVRATADKENVVV